MPVRYISNTNEVGKIVPYRSTKEAFSNYPTKKDEQQVFLLHANGDLSPSHHNLTYNGGVKLDYVSTPVGSGAHYFDGTDDYISIPDSGDWSFGSSDFCIEAWVNTLNATEVIICQHRPSDASRAGFMYQSMYGLFFLVRSGGTVTVWVKGTFTPSTNTWYHVAVSRSGNTWRIFVNGEDVTYEGGSNSSSILELTGDFTVGRYGSSVYSYHYGHLSDVRITKGSPRYTSNFTAPTERLTIDTNTVLLLSGRGDYGATGHSITTYNGVKESSDSYKFGGASLYCSGTTYAAAPHSDDFDFGYDNFTIDFWLYALRNMDHEGIITHTSGNPNYHGFYIQLMTTNISAGFFQQIITVPKGPLNEWVHYALVRRGTGPNDIFLAVNGQIEGTITGDISIQHTGPLVIGRLYAGTYNYHYQGYIDELRILKGRAAWTANFTPPTRQYRE